MVYSLLILSIITVLCTVNFANSSNMILNIANTIHIDKKLHSNFLCTHIVLSHFQCVKTHSTSSIHDDVLLFLSIIKNKILYNVYSLIYKFHNDRYESHYNIIKIKYIFKTDMISSKCKHINIINVNIFCYLFTLDDFFQIM